MEQVWSSTFGSALIDEGVATGIASTLDGQWVYTTGRFSGSGNTQILTFRRHLAGGLIDAIDPWPPLPKSSAYAPVSMVVVQANQIANTAVYVLGRAPDAWGASDFILLAYDGNVSLRWSQRVDLGGLDTPVVVKASDTSVAVAGTVQMGTGSAMDCHVFSTSDGAPLNKILYSFNNLDHDTLADMDIKVKANGPGTYISRVFLTGTTLVNGQARYITALFPGETQSPSPLFEILAGTAGDGFNYGAAANCFARADGENQSILAVTGTRMPSTDVPPSPGDYFTIAYQLTTSDQLVQVHSWVFNNGGDDQAFDVVAGGLVEIGDDVVPHVVVTGKSWSADSTAYQMTTIGYRTNAATADPAWVGRIPANPLANSESSGVRLQFLDYMLGHPFIYVTGYVPGAGGPTDIDYLSARYDVSPLLPPANKPPIWTISYPNPGADAARDLGKNPYSEHCRFDTSNDPLKRQYYFSVTGRTNGVSGTNDLTTVLYRDIPSDCQP